MACGSMKWINWRSWIQEKIWWANFCFLLMLWECCRVCLHLKCWWEEWHLQLWCCVVGACYGEKANWACIWWRCWPGEMGDEQNPKHCGAVRSTWPTPGVCFTQWHDLGVESGDVVLEPAPTQPTTNAWGGATSHRSQTQKLQREVKCQH